MAVFCRPAQQPSLSTVFAHLRQIPSGVYGKMARAFRQLSVKTKFDNCIWIKFSGFIEPIKRISERRGDPSHPDPPSPNRPRDLRRVVFYKKSAALSGESYGLAPPPAPSRCGKHQLCFLTVYLAYFDIARFRSTLKKHHSNACARQYIDFLSFRRNILTNFGFCRGCPAHNKQQCEKNGCQTRNAWSPEN